MSKHLVFIIGTRAQLIKVAPVIAECERQNLPCTLLMTGQHLETMHDLLEEFGIHSPPLSAVPAREHSTVSSLARWLPLAYHGVRTQLERIGVAPAQMDILVHGDTLSTVIGALAGNRLGARVIHLESGLTSQKLWDPFPEEISRRIVFRLAHVAMCPSLDAVRHMRAHYSRCKSVHTHGNTILDAVSLVGVKYSDRDHQPPYLVASLHRFQNIYDLKRLEYLVGLLETVAKKYPIHFVLHPATRKRLVHANLLDRLANTPNIRLSPRLGYGAFLRLAAGAACVLTDGGSNQEELAALGVPTIVMRKATERNDGIGSNIFMEGHISNGVADFLISQDYLSLSKPIRPLTKSPSSIIVQYLTGVASDSR